MVDIDELGWPFPQKVAIYVGDAIELALALAFFPSTSASEMEDIKALAGAWQQELESQWK